MSLIFNLGTVAPLSEADVVSGEEFTPVTIEVGEYKKRMRLPHPGQNIVESMDVHQLGLPVKNELLTFDVEIMMPAGVAHFYKNIGIDDSVYIIQTGTNSFLANVTHNKMIEECRAICPDGKEGQPCVDCRVGDVTFRICC